MKVNHPHSARRHSPGYCLIIFLFSATLFSCREDYSPKPKAYPRVIYPERKYELFQPAGCPFQFEKPVYAIVHRDTSFFNEKLREDQCWMNVDFPTLNGTINLTYKEIKDTVRLVKLIDDAHKLAYKHTRKANYIDEIRIDNVHGVGGILYDVGGDAASNVQFFLTDSSKHFLRGALYFYTSPNSDSMAPVLSFVKEDMKQILKTFRWK